MVLWRSGPESGKPVLDCDREMFVSKKKRYMFYANVKYDILSWLNMAGRIRG